MTVYSLQEERKTWENFAKQPMRCLLASDPSAPTSEPAPASIPATISDSQPPDSSLPPQPPASSIDVSLLDPQQSALLSTLLPASSSDDILHTTTARLRTLTDSLEFTIDQLAQGVHRVGQYHATAERVGARILSSAATQLEERQQAVLTRAGTKEVPMQEVLRSLAAIER